MKSAFFILLLLISQTTFAQNTDSITLVKAKWQKQKIAPKTKLITHHFNQKNLFAANQYISYIEIKRKGNAPVFAFGNEIKEKKTTSTFGKELHAFAAINGTFFDVANGGSVDFIKMDGVIIKQNVLDKNGNRARHQKAAIVIDQGKLSLKKWDNSPNWENSLTEKDVMLSGPLLTFNLQNEQLDTTSFTKARHPRTAVGIKPGGNIILLTVDGRQENAAGMSLYELTSLMRWLGCTSSINLDGGGSTTLWVSSYAENGVVNFPSDNKKWDHEGERKVANVILLKKKQ
ncbi:phosphodiester glycosidase family protein [Pedobacter frigiditerrae]|uniref:Phosphodiester glycosidase family protein n=1 Tax=Pedobacter frigiditerrae TaxID=2530452 RepID=A0A4R0N223_9SPHI|nr:phosphodiester glycosidase family protein [Pedobacter frigiditerrae]TCC93790.1 phosphodiester glycosidase family protein [Pedobacter frigiditerrae]